jgi:hypothetical protein
VLRVYTNKDSKTVKIAKSVSSETSKERSDEEADILIISSPKSKNQPRNYLLGCERRVE